MHHPQVSAPPHVQAPVTATWFAQFRTWLRGHPQVATFVRSTRAVIHFGPWRPLFRTAIRWLRPPIAEGGGAPSLLPALDIPATVAALEADGVFVAGVLPPDVVARLRAVTDQLPLDAYMYADEGNADVRAVVNDPGVLALLRRYFGSEPALLECTLVVHEPRRTEDTGPNSQRRFHFDYAGWQSLNMFVYLTDVDAGSAAHEIAVGTHQRRALRDAVRPSLTDEEALARFAPVIRTITGPAGTVFFENTEAFHRRGAAGKRRVMLNVLYASHRGLFSRGRLGTRYSDYLARRATPAPPPRNTDTPAARSTTR